MVEIWCYRKANALRQMITSRLVDVIMKSLSIKNLYSNLDSSFILVFTYNKIVWVYYICVVVFIDAH